MDSYNSTTTKPLFRASQVVWYVLSVVEAILITRLFLRLLEANPNAAFTDFIYSLSRPLVQPFRAVFSSTNLDGNVLEWTTLLAMFVYWVVALGAIQLFSMSRSVSTVEAAEELGRTTGPTEEKVVTKTVEQRY